jgi:hypothetical protein
MGARGITTYERQRVVAGREQAGERRNGECRVVGHRHRCECKGASDQCCIDSSVCVCALLTMRGGVPTQRRPSFVRV